MCTANKSSTDQAGHPLRILIVDDDSLGRSLMEAMLAPQGYQLDFACDGAEALAAIETRTYDLVFIDLVLPDMNGRDVCRQVRATEAGQRHLPIVAVTAYDLPGQPAELVRAGMDDYIFKPYDLRTLTRIIKIYAIGDGKTAARADGSAEPDAPVLDMAGPLEDFSNDVEAYQGLLRDFIQSLPVRLGKMQQAEATGNYVTLGREAHSLKGISAGLGAMRLSRLASQLNKACAGAENVAIGDLLNDVEQGMEALRREAPPGSTAR